MILNIDLLVKKLFLTFELSKQEFYVRVKVPKIELKIFLIRDHNVFLEDGKFDQRILSIWKFFLVKRMKLVDMHYDNTT